MAPVTWRLTPFPLHEQSLPSSDSSVPIRPPDTFAPSPLADSTLPGGYFLKCPTQKPASRAVPADAKPGKARFLPRAGRLRTAGEWFPRLHIHGPGRGSASAGSACPESPGPDRSIFASCLASSVEGSMHLLQGKSNRNFPVPGRSHLGPRRPHARGWYGCPFCWDGISRNEGHHWSRVSPLGSRRAPKNTLLHTLKNH